MESGIAERGIQMAMYNVLSLFNDQRIGNVKNAKKRVVALTEMAVTAFVLSISAH